MYIIISSRNNKINIVRCLFCFSSSSNREPYKVCILLYLLEISGIINLSFALSPHSFIRFDYTFSKV
jgi:hypothetical protein